MKRDLKRLRNTSLVDLVRRFELSAEQVLDKRIHGLLRHKLALDEEIRELLASGAREARVKKTAKLLGFTEQELAGDRNKIAWIIQSVFESRQSLAALRPTTQILRPGDTNAKSR